MTIKIPHVLSGGAAVTTDIYYPIMSGGSSTVNTTVEANAQTKMYRNGVVSNIFVYIVSNTHGSAATLRFRKNGANGNGSITIPAGGTGRFEDTTNSDTFTVGDLINLMLDRPGAGNSLTSVIGCYIDGEGPYYTTVGCFGSTNFSTAGSTTDVPQVGLLRSGVAGANGNASTIEPFIAMNYQANISGNTCTSDTTIQMRKGAGAAVPSIVVPGGTGNIVEDTVNTESFVAGNTLSHQIVRGINAGAFTLTRICQEQEYIRPCTQFYNMFITGQGWNSTTPFYVCPSGSSPPTATEAEVQLKMIGSGTISNFIVRVSANVADAAVTFTVRKNGVDTLLAVAIGAGAAGTFTDNVNSFTFDDGDLISIQYSKPTGTGATTTRWLTELATFDDYIPMFITT